MNQLRRFAAGAAREVALLDDGDAEPPHRGITRDPRAVDATADDEKIEGGSGERVRKGRTACSQGALCHTPRAFITPPAAAAG